MELSALEEEHMSSCITDAPWVGNTWELFFNICIRCKANKAFWAVDSQQKITLNLKLQQQVGLLGKLNRQEEESRFEMCFNMKPQLFKKLIN